jgi:diketogulonate reductase-like aldo/keto reductase
MDHSRRSTLRLLGTTGFAALNSMSAHPAEARADASASVALSDGTRMPAIGYGTCCRPSAKGELLITSTKEYLAQGGRLIDTAQLYENERELGVAIQQSGVPRADIWVTDKINTGPWKGAPVNTRAGTVASVRASLQALDTDYIDLMHIHGTWSIDAAEQVEVWRGLIEAKEQGLVRRIGVSNFLRSAKHAPPHPNPT